MNKNKLFLFAMMVMTLLSLPSSDAYAARVPLTYDDPVGTNPLPHKSPILIPEVDLEGYTLTFDALCNDRWLYLYMNPLCDPELTIYTKTPISVPHLQIAHRYYDLSISYQMNTKICITSRFDQGNSYYLLYNYMGPHTFSLQPNEYLVTVTYPNSVPYRTIFSNVVYLQNESLENNLNVDAEQVVIGSNVASNRSQGPVTVENGSSAISTRDGTTIHNDFEVKMGASLEITTNTSDLF